MTEGVQLHLSSRCKAGLVNGVRREDHPVRLLSASSLKPLWGDSATIRLSRK
jgi:hypothetical protein